MWSVTASACSEQDSLSFVYCQFIQRNCDKQQLFAEQYLAQCLKYLIYYSPFLSSALKIGNTMLLLAPKVWYSSELYFPLTHMYSELSFADGISLYCELQVNFTSSQKMIYLSNLYLGSSCGFASATIILSATIVYFCARRISWLFSNWKFFLLLAQCLLMLCSNL